MARLAVIGDEMTVLGMKLAGVSNSHVGEPENVQDVYNKIKDGADIIVVTQSLFRGIKAKEEEKIMVQIPDMGGGGEDTTKDLVKKVVGFEVKA